MATAFFTDRALYDGRLRDMLRNEIRYTNAGDGIPGNLELKTGKLGPPSLFGAAEYAKDGLLAITELLGRTPWFYRMADMTAALMEHAPVDQRLRQRCRTRARSSTATCCRRSCASPP